MITHCPAVAPPGLSLNLLKGYAKAASKASTYFRPVIKITDYEN